MPKRNKHNSIDFFWAKQTDKETPKDHRVKLLELEKECHFLEFNTKLLITSITDRELGEKLLKEKHLDVPKVVEQIQQDTYDRNKKTLYRKLNYPIGKKTSKKSL